MKKIHMADRLSDWWSSGGRSMKAGDVVLCVKSDFFVQGRFYTIRVTEGIVGSSMELIYHPPEGDIFGFRSGFTGDQFYLVDSPLFLELFL